MYGHHIISIAFIMAIWDTCQIPWVIKYAIFACIAVLPFVILFYLDITVITTTALITWRLGHSLERRPTENQRNPAG
jgi:hypothetical protein